MSRALTLIITSIILSWPILAVAAEDNSRALSLPELISLALEHNRDTQKAWAAVRQSAASHAQNLSDNYPALAAAGNWSTNHHFSPGVTAHRYGPSLNLSYLLLDFGERSHGHEVTHAALLASQHQQLWTVQSVILEVIEAYTRTLDAHEECAAKEADLKDAEQSLALTNARSDAGLQTVTDVLQMKAAVANTRIQLENARGQVEIALARLKNALGLPLDKPLRVAQLPDTLVLPEMTESVGQYLASCAAKREDLQAAELEVKRREAERAKAAAAGRPRVTVEASGGRNFHTHTDHDPYNAGVAVQISIPLFHGGLYRQGVKRAEAELEMAQADLANRESDAALGVLTNYWALKTATQKYLFTQEYLDYSQEAFSQAQEQVKEGVGEVRTLLDTQQLLTDARLQHLRAKTEWILSFARLTYASGLLSKEVHMFNSPGEK